ncbi:hypothetical protein CRYUN_Cryun23aG0016000 [Craigia yunnanensis]
MASIGFSSALYPTKSLLFSPCLLGVPRNMQTKQQITQFSRVIASSSTSSSELTTEAAVAKSAERHRTSFGLKNLSEIFWVDVHRAEGGLLNVRLDEPLTIASSRLEEVENVAIRVELSNGCVGWGAPVILNLAFDQISKIVPGSEFASVRADLEMELIDAVANSIDVPLWRLFGGVSNTCRLLLQLSHKYKHIYYIAMNIPIVSSAKAFDLAAKYCKLGFKTLKIEVGRGLNADIEVLQAVRAAHRHCLFILDANEGYTSKDAIEVLEKLNEKGVTPVLFEQPVHRDDWRGLGDVSTVAREKYGISVSADESCRNLVDIQKLRGKYCGRHQH